MKSDYIFNYCDICNKNEGEIKLSDGWICRNCKNSIKTYSAEYNSIIKIAEDVLNLLSEIVERKSTQGRREI